MRATALPVRQQLELEHARFLQLFSVLSEHTTAYLQSLEPHLWQAMPVDAPTLFLGKRVNKITIAALLRHLILAETHWVKSIRDAKDGAVIPMPANAAALDDVEAGHVKGC